MDRFVPEKEWINETKAKKDYLLDYGLSGT